MDIPATTVSGKGKAARLILKLAVTAVCLWYVSGKIDFHKAGTALGHADAFYLLLAMIAFVLSKLIAAVRLNIYFRNIGVRLPEIQNIKLYWLGMFYNLFLPGSIGGDAYKVIVLKRKINTPYKKTTAAVLLDRFSGLLGLGMLLAVYGCIVLHNIFYVSALLAGVLLAIVITWFIIIRWLKDFKSSFFPTLLLGVFVQASQVVCAYCIMTSLHIPVQVTAYIFLFLLSSIVAVLPFTIGGLGAREIVFLEGAAYFGLVQENAVLISILFYLITLFTSSWGLFYVFNNPLQKIKDPALGP